MNNILRNAFFVIVYLTCLSACGDDEEDRSGVVYPTEQNGEKKDSIEKDSVKTQIQLLIDTWVRVLEYGDIYEINFMDNGKCVHNIYIDGQIDDIFEGTYTVNGDTIISHIQLHKEHCYGSVWAEKELNDVKEIRFQIEGDSLIISSLTDEETLVYTRKQSSSQ